MPIHGGYKNNRLQNFDYHNGWFFITNKTDFAKSYFVGETRSLIKSEVMDLVQKTKGVGLDYFHIMPNHIHVIVIFEDAEIPLQEFWRRFKALTTFKAKKIGFREKSLWQRNYFEHVIRNDRALEVIRKYIENNPLKENLAIEEIYQQITIKSE